MTSTKIGVVGAGVIARRHVRTLSRFPDVQVRAVADVQAERAQDLAATVGGAHAYDDPHLMLDQEQLDAVYLCVPPFAHGELDLEVVRRGLPMFVEKPIAADLATAERIAVAVEQAGQVTGVGHHWRWLDTVEAARELLADNPARLVSGYWLDSTPPIRWWQQATSGGQFVEQTVHIVDLARVLVGEIEEVFAYTARTPRTAFPDMDTAEVTAATVRFTNGAVGSFTSTCLLGWPHRIGLDLFADGLAVELSEKQMRVNIGPGETVVAASGDPFEREDRAFIDEVQGARDRTRTTYAEALRTHRITTGVLRSAAQGRPVLIETSRDGDV